MENVTVNIELSSKLGKLIRRSIYMFLDNMQSEFLNAQSILFSITSIKIHRTKMDYVITIESYRPGLLIGKQGCKFNELVNHLQTELFDIFADIGITFSISITECKLWSNMS